MNHLRPFSLTLIAKQRVRSKAQRVAQSPNRTVGQLSKTPRSPEEVHAQTRIWKKSYRPGVAQVNPPASFSPDSAVELTVLFEPGVRLP